MCTALSVVWTTRFSISECLLSRLIDLRSHLFCPCSSQPCSTCYVSVLCLVKAKMEEHCDKCGRTGHFWFECHAFPGPPTDHPDAMRVEDHGMAPPHIDAGFILARTTRGRASGAGCNCPPCAGIVKICFPKLNHTTILASINP